MYSFSRLRHKKKNNWETVKNYTITLHLYNPVKLTDNCLPLKLVSEKWKEHREHVEKSKEVWGRAFQKAGYIYSESHSHPESYYFRTTMCSIQSNMICKQGVSDHFNKGSWVSSGSNPHSQENIFGLFCWLSHQLSKGWEDIRRRA